MPVELIIGKVSFGPLANTSFSGSTGIGTISLSGFSLTASGKDCPSVLLPLATMVPSCSKVMSALSESLILKGTPRSLMVMVKLLPCSVSWQFWVSMMIWSIPTTVVPSGSMSITSPGTSTSLPIAVPPARGPLSTSWGSGSGDEGSGGRVLVVVPVVPVVLVPVAVPVVPVVPVVLVLVVVPVVPVVLVPVVFVPVVPVVLVPVVACPHAGNANTNRKVRATNIVFMYGTDFPLLIIYLTNPLTIAYLCKQCNDLGKREVASSPSAAKGIRTFDNTSTTTHLGE